MIQDEDNRTERTFGDITQRKKYSHVDLIHMIGGMDAERGTVTAGGRGYYLMVSTSFRSISVSLTQHLEIFKYRLKLYDTNYEI